MSPLSSLTRRVGPDRRPGRGIPSARQAGPLLLALAALALIVRPASAQVTGLEGSGHAGLLAPQAPLIEGEGGPRAELENGLLVAATAGFRFPSGLGLEVAALRGFGLGPEGAALRTDEAAWAALTAHLTYRAGLLRVREVADPFVGIGAGLRRVGFGAVPTDGAAVDDQTDPTGVLLAGFYVDLTPRLHVRIEGRSYLSSFAARGQSNPQHDLALLGGLVANLP